MKRDERGFTLVELLVVLLFLSVVTVGFYQVMFSGTGADVTRSVVRISEEARLGFNRMIRDSREAAAITQATPTSYSIDIDFDRSGSITPTPGANGSGDYEMLTFAYDAASQIVRLNGEVLMTGVRPISGNPIFSYTSNRLEYDLAPADGVTSQSEIESAVGNSNGVIDLPSELALVTGVVYAMEIEVDDRITEFYSETQLRNKRSGEE